MANIDSVKIEIEAELVAEIQRLRATLQSILDADWRNWQELADPNEFVRWAKSRANHALTLNAMSEDKGRQVKPHRSGGGLPLPRELPPLPNYVQCVKCGGTHPSYHSCLGPQEPPRPAGHNPKA